MDYIETTFVLSPPEIGEILTAYLGELGFDTFEDTADGLRAYIPARDYDEDRLKSMLDEQAHLGTIRWESKLIPARNWNEEWEKSFTPVVVQNCCIRASFHTPPPEASIDIIIEPKMSFGTGHHETTSLMVEQMLGMDFKDKTVLDMGAGTGILSILASRLGAAEVTAIDIDEWAYANCLENLEKNGTTNVRTVLGNADTAVFEKKVYNVILANINRNILMKDFSRYDSVLERGGHILTSGFLELDAKQITDTACSFGYKPVRQLTRNLWTLLAFSKP